MSGNRQSNPPTLSHEVALVGVRAVSLRGSKSSLDKLAQDGKVPGQKVGRHWRFHRATIDRWLSRDGDAHSE